ncbi:MAG: hypothetical protein IJS93_00780 [Clostridia bacterium]|nr:hypothetical protein [Clostridia bacterium]
MQEFYYGKYEYILDEKNRLRLPAEFRNAVGPNVVIGEGDGKYLLVYGANDFKELQREKYDNYQKDQSFENEMKFKEFSTGFRDFKKDNQERFLIPSELVEYAELKSEVYVVGGVGGLEIWSKENYEHRYNLSFAHSKSYEIEMKKVEAAIEMKVEREFREKMAYQRAMAKMEALYGKLGEDDKK